MNLATMKSKLSPARVKVLKMEKLGVILVAPECENMVLNHDAAAGRGAVAALA